MESQFRSRQKIAAQLGTLGGGNHFLEVRTPLCFKTNEMQLVHDENGMVWIMLHSGSRNIGNTSATHYDSIARDVLRKKGIQVPPGLNYLEIDSNEGQAYLQDMEWCQA